jgi:YD repeat-containing protein
MSTLLTRFLCLTALCLGWPRTTLLAQKAPSDSLPQPLTSEQPNPRYTDRIMPASPDAAALAKYADIPVSNYTGTPTLDIPLYAIKTRDLDVPISISYHGSGVRVEEEASSVGLGWVLNAGGVIQHQIRGRDDFRETDAANSIWRYFADNANQGGADVCNYYSNANTALWFPKSSTPLQARVATAITMSGFERPDIERDLFSFNFLGITGKFILEPFGTGTQYRVHLLDQSDLRVELTNDDTSGWSGFTITGTDGTKYVFGQVERQRSRSENKLATGKTYVGTSPNTFYAINGWNYKDEFASAWYLTRIESQRGDAITLGYTTTTTWVNALPGRSEDYTTQVTYQPSGGPDPATVRWTITDTQTKPVSLTGIAFANGSVTFSRDTRQDLQAGATRLTGIAVTDAAGTLLKTVTFTHDYFSSGQASPDHIAKRLRLAAVQERNGAVCLPPYSFSYNTTTLPNKDSYQQDYWGYFNNQPGNETIGPAVTPTTTGIQGTLLPAFPLGNQTYRLPLAIVAGANRTPDPVAMKAGVLTSIRYPSGAVTTLDFEPHRFSNVSMTTPRPYFRASDQLGLGDRIGGGLRIRQIQVMNADNVAQTTTYDYTQPNEWSTPTGKLMYHLQFADFVTGGSGLDELQYTSAPRHPGTGAQGNPVGYSWVTVYKGSTRKEAGYSSYQYENRIDTQDGYYCFLTLAGPSSCNSSNQAIAFEFACDPFSRTVGGPVTNVPVVIPGVPNYTNVLNGRLLYEEHLNGSTPAGLLRTTQYTYETVNRQRIKSFKAHQGSTNGAYVGLTYYTDSQWTRPTRTVAYNYGMGSSTANPLSTTTTYGYSPGGVHKQTVATTVNTSKGELMETLTTYPADVLPATTVTTALMSRNMVVPLTQQQNKIEANQSRTPLNASRTTYALWHNSFMAPQQIESQVGSGPFVAEATFTYAPASSTASAGDVATVLTRDGQLTRFAYYTAGGKKYLPERMTQQPGTSLQRSTLYDYAPLKGLTLTTAPNGLSTYYSYDALGRLTTIKGPDQNVLKAFQYNYATGCQ